jgi:segregation and condensation protein B
MTMPKPSPAKPTLGPAPARVRLRKPALELARPTKPDDTRPVPTSTEPQLSERDQQVRILEALLFAAAEPLDVRTLARHFPASADVPALLLDLQEQYRQRGINLVRVAGKWAFRTAEDLSAFLTERRDEPKRLSRPALEMLAIIAYHQPVTRAEIEEIRGVATSKGTLDVLLETGWVRWRGRRRAPGRPLTYGTSDDFLSHFGLASLSDLPGLADLKGAGLLDGVLPAGFVMPDPLLLASLTADELPLEVGDDDPLDGELVDGEDEDRESDGKHGEFSPRPVQGNRD